MSEQEQQEIDDPYAKQAGMTAMQTADQVGVKQQAKEVSKRKFNPGFFERTTELDLDTELYDWLENELGAKGSRAHVLGRRDESYVEQQGLLNRNLAERMIIERQPGSLLKKNPEVLTVYQNVDSMDDEDAVTPIQTDRVRRQYRSLAGALTTRESLAVEGEFVDALTTATTETSHIDERDEESSSATTRRLRSVFS